MPFSAPSSAYYGYTGPGYTYLCVVSCLLGLYYGDTYLCAASCFTRRCSDPSLSCCALPCAFSRTCSAALRAISPALRALVAEMRSSCEAHGQGEDQVTNAHALTVLTMGMATLTTRLQLLVGELEVLVRISRHLVALRDLELDPLRRGVHLVRARALPRLQHRMRPCAATARRGYTRPRLQSYVTSSGPGRCTACAWLY